MIPASKPPRRIAVVTGTRAEFGLLRPVMRAIAKDPRLELRVLAAGAHLLTPALTVVEVESEFTFHAKIPMQALDSTTVRDRAHDAAAVGLGIQGFSKSFAELKPDVVVVLGDRIEAFAAAAAASVSGIRVAHLHGGDRAEGIADEAMRHAITKLAHIHFPATEQSALRIIAMGENPQRVHVVGSPAMDGLHSIPPAPTPPQGFADFAEIIFLLHPVGDEDCVEHERAARLIELCRNTAPTLLLHPNSDPGRAGVMRAIEESGGQAIAHLPRDQFIALLRQAKLIVGNSSAGLIECAALPVRAINIGPRQNGREKPSNVIDIPDWDYQTIQAEISCAMTAPPLAREQVKHPYGDGRTGLRTAEILATFELDIHRVRKCNAY